MTERDIDLEQLAAFIEGRLTGEARARVMTSLAESHAAYEVFAEMVRFQGEEAEAGGKVIAIAHRKPGQRVRRFAWKVLVPAAAAAALLLLVGRPLFVSSGRFDLASSQLVAPLTERTDISSALGRGWDQIPWRVTRGGRSRLVEPERAFRLGVRTVDLQVALLLDDAQLADRHISEMVEWLSEIELSQPVTLQYQAIQTRLTSAEAPTAVLPTCRVAEQALDEFLASPRLAVGQWFEAARLAAMLRDTTFFQSELTTRFLRATEDFEFSEQDVEALSRITALIGAGPGGADWDELRQLISEVIRRNSG